MEATLINVFIVPDELEEEFLKRWTQTSAHYRSGGALIEAHLHRNSGLGNNTFRYINVARWTSADAWREAHQDYVPGEYGIEGVVGHPSIYEAVADIYSDILPVDQSGRHWITAAART
jgi:heme-degrading monooxygenase HmoA